jgi:hypothetical protein
MAKRTFVYREGEDGKHHPHEVVFDKDLKRHVIERVRISNGRIIREKIEFTPNDRPSDWERTMLEGSLAERVLRGYRDIESEQGSSMKLKEKAETIKRAWAEPAVSA